MSTTPPEDGKSAAPEGAVAKPPLPGQPIRLEHVMDFAFLEVMAKERLNLSRRGLACS